jgi:tRNA (guanine26-N2/guanine27-N2)-dimethyltransferase
LLTAGPIYLGPVADSGFAEAVTEHVTDEMGEAARARRLLETVAAELDTPTHYDQHRLCKSWSRSAVGMDEFVAELRDAGFRATRAHYSGTAFKTDATVGEIRDATAE